MQIFAKLNDNRSIKNYSNEYKDGYQSYTIDESDSYFLPEYYNLMWADDNHLIHAENLPLTSYDYDLMQRKEQIKDEDSQTNEQLNSMNKKIDDDIDQSLQQSTKDSQQRFNDLEDTTTRALKENYDSITKIKPTDTREDAIEQGDESNQPQLLVYPSKKQAGKAIEVNSLYSFGNKLLPDINIPIDNPDTSKFEYDNVYITFDQNNKVFHLHGNIKVLKDINANESIGSIDISNMIYNTIKSSYIQYQPISISVIRGQVIALTSVYAQRGGFVYNVEGPTISLGYDKDVTGIPEGTTLWPLGYSNVMLTPKQDVLYYVPAELNVYDQVNSSKTGKVSFMTLWNTNYSYMLYNDGTRSNYNWYSYPNPPSYKGVNYSYTYYNYTGNTAYNEFQKATNNFTPASI